MYHAGRCNSSAITSLAIAELDCHWVVIWSDFLPFFEHTIELPVADKVADLSPASVYYCAYLDCVRLSAVLSLWDLIAVLPPTPLGSLLLSTPPRPQYGIPR